MNKKTCVIINDFTTCAEIALGIQMPVLRDMGAEVLPVPSKLLSYPLCREDAVALNTTDFATQMINNWIASGEGFDAVLTGFIPDASLSELAAELCATQKKLGARIFIDPVLGDNGHAYKSIKPENLAAMKKLLKEADYCLPNYTEACLLTDTEYREGGVNAEEISELLSSLVEMGASNPIITGALVDGKTVVALKTNNEVKLIEYEQVKGNVSGTGDRFAALFVGFMLKGDSPEQAIRKAEEKVTEFLKG